MKEAYVKSNVYDLTGGLGEAPPDDGYNIVASAYLPTGPVGKIKVNSQNEFIKKFMIGTKMSPADHISALYIYQLLAKNPVHLLRACPNTFLEGISSLGNKYLFDSSFNLLTQYSKFNIDTIKDPLAYYYLVIGNNCYFTGDDEDIPTSEVGAAVHVEVNDEKSLDYLMEDLLTVASDNDPTVFILKSERGVLVSRSPISVRSTNIGKFTEIKRGGQYSRVTDASISAVTEVKELDNIAINGVTYYFMGINIHSTTGMLNPIPITSPDNKEFILNKYFLLKVIAESGADFYGNYTVGILDKEDVSNVSFLTTNAKGFEVVGTSIKMKGNTRITPTDDITTAPFIEATVAGETIKFMVTTDATAEEDTVVIATSEISSAAFLDKVMTWIISNNPTLYCSDDDTYLNITGSLTLLNRQDNGSLTSNYYNVTKDTGTDYTYYYYLSTDNNNNDFIKYDFLWIVVGNYFYYTGSIPAGFVPPEAGVSVKMQKGAVTPSEFRSLLLRNLNTTQGISRYEGAYVSSQVLDLDFDEDVMEVSTGLVNQEPVELFAVVQKFPSSGNVLNFQFSTNADNEDIINLTLNYKDGVEVADWTMSFVPGVVDGYMIDQWYTRVTSDYFKVVQLVEDGERVDSYVSPKYGEGIELPDYDVQYMKDAIDSIPEYEDGIKYDLILDSGVVDPGLAASVETIAKQLFIPYPVSVPAETTNEQDLIDYVGATGINSFYARILAAGDRENVAGFSVVMPGSIKIARAYIDAFRNKANEFAPNYEATHGVVGVSSLVQEFKKTTREKLLDYKIATLKGGSGSPYFINDNVTAQPGSSYMSEEQNVRMTCTAVHVVDDYAKRFKAEFNNSTNRQICQDGVNDVLRERLMKGKAYAPVSYRGVCDDSNNPIADINNNIMRISLYAQYNPSTKWVLVDHFIVPLTAN